MDESLFGKVSPYPLGSIKLKLRDRREIQIDPVPSRFDPTKVHRVDIQSIG